MRCWVFAGLLAGCASGAGIGNSTFGEPPPPPDDDDDGTGTTTPTSGVSVSLSGADGESTAADDLSGSVTEPRGTTGDTGPTTSGDDASTSTDGGPQCGNGTLEEGEECDGDDLGEMTCPDVDADYNAGVLACDAGCSFDVAGCVSLENPYEVCDQVDIAIPDAGSPITAMITIPDEENIGVVDSMRVTVELDHTWIGDLTIDVDHGGAAPRLFDTSCGSADNLHVVFNDAGGAFDCLDPDAGNDYAPEDPLAGFAGDEMGNTWTLTVQDNVGADVGTLNRWCVSITWE